MGGERPGGRGAGVRPHWSGGSDGPTTAAPVRDQAQPCTSTVWGWAGSEPLSRGDGTSSRFLRSVGSTNWLSTVTQYSGAGAAVKYEGTWSDNASVPPTSPTGTQIAAEASRARTHWGLTSLNDQVVVAMPQGVNLTGVNPNWCAYHSSVSGITFTGCPTSPVRRSATAA